MKRNPVLSGFCGLFMFLTACSGGGGGSSGSAPPNQPPVTTATYSISGTVSGDTKQNVTIAVSGAVSATTHTDPEGSYSIAGLPNGAYTVTASKAGYSFAQASKSVVIGGSDSLHNDFTATAVLYTVSGTINGAVISGVSITVTGTTEGGSSFAASATASEGNYSVPAVPNGNYTVSPAKTGYSFSPASLAVTISAANASVAAFTSSVDSSVQFNLTGAVSGAIKAGVTVNVTGPASGSAVTDADGTYTVAHLPNGTYDMTASKAGYTFGDGLTTTIDGADSIGNNFTAVAVLYSLSGSVSGDVTSGVTIQVAGTTESGAAFGPSETTTSSNGSYSVDALPNGNYTVIAAKNGYLFNPASSAITIAAANSSDRDFIAMINPLTALRASGGTGANGTGGDGGYFGVETYGSLNISKSGSVDASFTAPSFTQDLGANPFTVSADTQVSDSDNTPNTLCQIQGGDGTLYIGDGSGTCGDDLDSQVTGLVVASGVTLTLVDEQSGYGSLRLENDLVIRGTVTSDLSLDNGLNIEANVIDVESTGKISASATEADQSGGEIYLGNGQGLTQTIINRGTIEAVGKSSGSGGYVYFEPDELVFNEGTIDVSGGNAGGSGGEFDALVDYGDFYSSGTVRMNGGSGISGGETEYSSNNWDGYSCHIETGYVDNTRGRNGDIAISGTWEAIGGDGSNGSGGSGGYMYFQTDGMGNIKVNANMSVKGGNGVGEGFTGGYGGEIDFYSTFNGSVDNPFPGRISVGGIYDLRGGNGTQDGGNGGYLYANSGTNPSGVGSDVEFIGVPVIVLNGGQGSGNAWGGSGGNFELYTHPGSSAAKSISIEADFLAKGGDASLSAGSGGSFTAQTEAPGDSGSVLSSSGNVDVSGGAGDTGGQGGEITLQAQHVGNSGNLTAAGGNGSTGGGNGGNIGLTSDESTTPTTNTGTLSAPAGQPGGDAGTITIDGNSVGI